MLENSLGIASTAGIHFPEVGRQSVCLEVCYLGSKGEEQKPHSQTKQYLNVHNFFLS